MIVEILVILKAMLVMKVSTVWVLAQPHFLQKMHDQSTSDAEQMTGHLSVSLCGNSHEKCTATVPAAFLHRPAARLTAFLVFIYVIDNSRAVLSACPLGCLQLSPHCLSPQRRTELEN